MSAKSAVRSTTGPRVSGRASLAGWSIAVSVGESQESAKSKEAIFVAGVVIPVADEYAPPGNIVSSCLRNARSSESSSIYSGFHESSAISPKPLSADPSELDAPLPGGGSNVKCASRSGGVLAGTESVKVLIPGNADLSLPLSALLSPVDALAERPDRDLLLKTHDLGGLDLRHRWHGAVASVVVDETHRNFWARHQSQDERRTETFLGSSIVRPEIQCHGTMVCSIRRPDVEGGLNRCYVVQIYLYAREHAQLPSPSTRRTDVIRAGAISIRYAGEAGVRFEHQPHARVVQSASAASTRRPADQVSRHCQVFARPHSMYTFSVPLRQVDRAERSALSSPPSPPCGAGRSPACKHLRWITQDPVSRNK